MTPYQKGMSVLGFLKGLNVNISTIADAMDIDHLQKSYDLIQKNPKITKEEFLKEMDLTEEDD